jgi:hypothetical protein
LEAFAHAEAKHRNSAAAIMCGAGGRCPYCPFASSPAAQFAARFGDALFAARKRFGRCVH